MPSPPPTLGARELRLHRAEPTATPTDVASGHYTAPVQADRRGCGAGVPAHAAVGLVGGGIGAQTRSAATDQTTGTGMGDRAGLASATNTDGPTARGAGRPRRARATPGIGLRFD